MAREAAGDFAAKRKQSSGDSSQRAIASDDDSRPDFAIGPGFGQMFGPIQSRSHGISIGPEPALKTLGGPFSPTLPGDRIGEDVDSFDAH